MNPIYLFVLLISLSFLAQAEAAIKCPSSTSTKVRKVPAYSFELNKNEKVVVCVSAAEVEDGKPKNKVIKSYEAHLFRRNKWVKKVLIGNYRTPVKLEQKKGELSEVMHLSLRGEYFPLFKEKIVCTKNECKRSEKTCVFNQVYLSPPGPREIAREKAIYSKGAAQVQEMSEGDLITMANLALTGREKAYNFFTRMDPQPITMGVAGAYYQHMRTLLSQLKNEGCLKIQGSYSKL